MNIIKIKRELRTLCRRPDLDIVFNKLLDEYLSDESEVYNSVIVLSRDWNDIRRKANLGTPYTEEENKRKNSITDRLLKIITKEIDEYDLSSAFSDNEDQTKELSKLSEVQNLSEQSHKVFEDDLLERKTLNSIIFSNCDFDECIFKKMSFENVRFINCTFNKVIFAKVTFYKVEILNCDVDAKFKSDFLLSKSSFYRSNLINVYFGKGKIVETDFTESKLVAMTMDEDIDVLRPNFSNADLSNSNIFSEELSPKDLIVCKSLLEANLPDVLAAAIAKSRHGTRLFSQDQLKKYYPSHPSLLEEEPDHLPDSDNEDLSDERDQIEDNILSDEEDKKEMKEASKLEDFLNAEK